ncbi:uncharacterized protein A4U43_C06F17470 [Asparagus officinalis]|uniref:SPX domain-containing protein n=1 Tax=Asparagus officinalis TaxID=4686 RepID=A0A5P1ET17_ASPOF|nr:uncharacterized protein A4U43_C06F17470 [Asparagus officinalis]
MKFEKSLSNQIEETLPEWRDKFLSYKDLKKKLKLIAAGSDRPAKRAKTSAGSGTSLGRAAGSGGDGDGERIEGGADEGEKGEEVKFSV